MIWGTSHHLEMDISGRPRVKPRAGMRLGDRPRYYAAKAPRHRWTLTCWVAGHATPLNSSRARSQTHRFTFVACRLYVTFSVYGIYYCWERLTI